MPGVEAENSYEHITGYWEWTVGSRDIYHNPALKNTLGYQALDFPDKMSNWMALVFPEDLRQFRIIFARHVQSGGEIPFAHEIRFRHKNGSTVFILLTGKVQKFTAEGKPEYMLGNHINLTAQKLAEKELKRTRDFLERTSEVAMVGGWELDMLHQKVTWSAVTRQIFGVDKDFEPATGTSAFFFREGKDRNLLLEAFHKAITTGEPYDLELQIITATGALKWTRTVGHPEFEDGKCIRIYGIFQDITIRKTQEEALRQKQEQLETFIKYSPVAIAMMDKHFNYVAVSDVWVSCYNLDMPTLLGRSHFEVFPELPGIWMSYLSRCLRGEVIKKEEDSFFLINGRREWLRWEVRPWYESAGTVGGIIMFTELITEKKQIQEALIKAKEDAEQAALIKSRFLSIMSHEIRTPMNGVIGFTNLLLKNPREDQREALNVLKFSAQNLMVIINDVLNLNKIDAGKVELENISFDLYELLQNICRSQENDAKEKHLNLSVQFDYSLPFWFKGDPVRIGQVITNLVNNAIKFTAAGRVSISTALVGEHEGKMTIGFAVSDTGIGIPETKQEHIFELFSQAESDTTRIYGGTGLGLTITKRLLELMGSNIQLKSTPGEGSIFYFDLELEKSTLPVEETSGLDTPRHAHTLKGSRILIADDNPVNVLVVKRFLQQWHADYDVAENGRIALEKVTANQYDLVLMDLKMPVMDGYEATIEIRKLEGKGFADLPVIALTASTLLEMKEEMINSGMNDFVMKPFDPESLFNSIKRLVSPS
ncbi:PAS domain S-box protein [Mucilaginibacter paludis]|uniref:histidine kinase n=1 Tax=Mucilaginibacter paludis DSM 18603 TaxID=714943 RepID=H1Y1G0_9SPHI|nr:PAS domain S-box protein [Mucilaginibacter paludis]EHQ30834.1 PAS/PAC sensor hybrid histidine kinase [Mucilaginibacter paludis DSM 18603]